MSHRHVDPEAGACVEVGTTVCLRPFVHGGRAGIRDEDGGVAGGPTEHLAGFFVAHDATDLDGYRCEGAVNVDPHLAKEPGGNWTASGTLEGGDLSLSPSILCRRDGFHGFVRDGKWVSA